MLPRLRSNRETPNTTKHFEIRSFSYCIILPCPAISRKLCTSRAVFQPQHRYSPWPESNRHKKSAYQQRQRRGETDFIYINVYTTPREKTFGVKLSLIQHDQLTDLRHAAGIGRVYLAVAHIEQHGQFLCSTPPIPPKRPPLSTNG